MSQENLLLELSLSKRMIFNLFLNDFERSDLSSGSRNSMLLDSELNAFESGKLCFRSRRAML